MITLIDASRRGMDADGPRDILAPTSLIFGEGERVGILAARGSGKSVIARLLCGIDQPDTGAVVRAGRVSWQLGAAGALHPDLTVAENIGIVARLTGEDPLSLTALCEVLGGLAPILQRPMKTVSPAQRAAVAWCVAAGVTCDTYIADDTIGFGLDRQRDMSEAFLLQRLETAGLVFLSSNPQQIARFCQRYFVLIAGQLIPCPDLSAGQAALTSMHPLHAPAEAESLND
jgi:capsular polysaccharide transport system ATP-binding protein